MRKSTSKPRRKKAPTRVLARPDLERSKRVVLNGLTSASRQRTCDHAIREFVAWYCSEPRTAFNRIVVVRYRIHLESCSLAANTINQHLAAVHRLAHEAADAGLLSPDLAAGIARVKGVKQLGQRSGELAHSRSKLCRIEASTGRNASCQKVIGDKIRRLLRYRTTGLQRVQHES